MNQVRPWIFVFVPFNKLSLSDLFVEKTSLSLLLSLQYIQGFLNDRRTLQETSPEDDKNKKKNKFEVLH